MHYGDRGPAGFSCGLKTLGLAALIITAAIISATPVAADDVDPWESRGPEGSISDFSGVIAGYFDFNSGPDAHVTLDGTDLSWLGEFHFQTFDIEEIYAVDPELWKFYPFRQLNVWSASLSVRGGGELTAVNVYASGDKLMSVDGVGSVFNVLSKFEFDSDMATLSISNGGVVKCDIFDASYGSGNIEVDGAGSALNVHTILDMKYNHVELSISNGGTVTADSLRGGYITISGAGSRLKVSSEYRESSYYSGVNNPPGIRARDGGSFLAGSNIQLPRSTVLDVSDGGYAQIGGDLTLPILPGTVRVGNGGALNSFGTIEGHLLVEDGGAVYQRYTPTRSDGDIVIIYYTPQKSAIDVSSVEIKPGGRMVVQADQYSLESPDNLSSGTIVNTFYPFRDIAPWLRVQDHAALHGTIEVKLTGDTLPQPEQTLRLVESLGTMDITGLKIESAPWLQATPVLTDEGLSASFQFAGDGTGGQHIGPGSHLSGIIATEIDDYSVVTAGIGRISWSNGSHLVADPQEQPGTLFVGYRGDATLAITGRTIENRSAYVGTHTKGKGKVFIEGPNAKWSFLQSDPQTDDSLWEEPSELVIGNRGGYGEVAVRDGASLDIAAGNIKIGGGSTSTDYSDAQVSSTGIIASIVPYDTSGRLLISGDGSTVKAAIVEFGSFGHRELRIEAGGKLTCDSFGAFTSQTFVSSSDPINIVIDGVGTALEVEGNIDLHRNQEYSITVSNGARVSTKNSFHGKRPGIYVDIFMPHTGITNPILSNGLIPIGGLPGDAPPLEKTTIIDGNGSAWDNAEEYYLYYGATLIARNSGQMTTRSFSIGDGNLQLETSARVLVAENITMRNANIDLQNGGAIHVGTNATGDIPDGTLVVGDGGKLFGNATINGDLVIESGGIVTSDRGNSFFTAPDATLDVNSIDLKPDGTLRIVEGRTGPYHGEVIVQGDADFSGIVEVGTFLEPIIIIGLGGNILRQYFSEEYTPPRYFPEQPVIFDLITVDGIADWSEATLIAPEDEMNRYTMHEHGLTVLKTPPPGDANGDGLINDDDASILVANWHSNEATWAMGDFDFDSDVDGDDMVIMAGNWQHTYERLYPWYYNGDYPPLDLSQVPEPSAALLLLSGICSVALLRRLRRGKSRSTQ